MEGGQRRIPSLLFVTARQQLAESYFREAAGSRSIAFIGETEREDQDRIKHLSAEAADSSTYAYRKVHKIYYSIYALVHTKPACDGGRSLTFRKSRLAFASLTISMRYCLVICDRKPAVQLGGDVVGGTAGGPRRGVVALGWGGVWFWNGGRGWERHPQSCR